MGRGGRPSQCGGPDLRSDPAHRAADAEMAARLARDTPMGRFVEPEEVAAAILFLVSDAARMITGVTLPVDGGWTAR
jgi:NAD(P)-dependent dehydrogenase (short-subunit alcohol dehydrogenase family)